MSEQGGSPAGSSWRGGDASESVPLGGWRLWRGALPVLLVWTFLTALSLVVSLHAVSQQGQRLARMTAGIADGGDRALQDQMEVWRDDLRHTDLTVAVQHGLCWLLGGGVILFLARRMLRRDLAETIQRENEIEFRTTMEATTVGVFRLRGMRFDFVNPAMASMFGYSIDEFLALSPMEVVVPEERGWVEAAGRRRVAGEPGRPYQVTALRKDGTTFTGLLWSNRIFYRDKSLIVGSVLDISERISAEQDMRRMVDALAASNMELERFAYIASHDLQEPLRSITSFSQLLEYRVGDKLDDDARESLHYIISGGKRMHALINDLLAFSRVSCKGTSFALVEIRGTIDSALQNLHESISETGAEITLGTLPAVFGDGMQLTQLFQNLIGNALKFRKPGAVPHVAVEARRQDDGYLFSVADDGIGIPQEYQEQIFTLFRRLHKGEAYPGTGVGLAICKRVIERHEGRLWVESSPGHGCTFFFTLPAPGTERAQALAARAEETASREG